MAVPKRKTSKSKRDKRRTHQKLSAPNLTSCPQCGDAKLPHHACLNCGFYKGHKILKAKQD